MGAQIDLTLEQIAQAILHLTPDELESLELMLEPKLVDEILKRSDEAKRGATIKLKDAPCFKGIK